MRFSAIFICAAWAGVVSGVPTVRTPHEKRDWVPASWELHERAAPEAVVPVRIGMRQRNLDEGSKILTELSDPASSKYGQWWTKEEIHDFFAPSTEAFDGIAGWLTGAGINANRISKSSNKQWVQFDGTIQELESLLDTKYHVYKHEEGRQLPACDQYHVPEHLRGHIDYITPGIHLGRATTLSKRAAQPKNSFKLPLNHRPLPKFTPLDDLTLCSTVVTPDCIKAMYNITNGTTAHAGNELGIFEDLGDYYSQQDLNDFFKGVYPIIPQGTHPTLKSIDGATGPVPASQAGGESDLDFQISYPIIWPQNSILFQTDDPVYEGYYTYSGFLDNFLDAIDGSFCSYSAYGINGQPVEDPPYPDPKPGGYNHTLDCGIYKPTNVISISYGGSELGLSVPYQRRQCDEYMKLGMQGITVVISSGDNGVDCDPYANNIFGPGFPVTCPYVTSVGATTIPPGATVHAQQVATTIFGSGGGFSNIFPTPDYQKAAVQGYLNKYPPPYNSYQTTNNQSTGANGGSYNSIGRGYPDIAAVGQGILTYTGGQSKLADGTSASAPLIAAIITRINEERLKAGKPTVGFINPTLYAHRNAFRDVTVGSSFSQPSIFSSCQSNGFAAQPGWDPVTGLGVPKYDALLKLFM